MQGFDDATGQCLHIGLVEHIGRHGIQRVADGAQHQAMGHGLLVVAARKVGQGGFDVPGPDHAQAARVAHAFGRDRSTVAHACHAIEDRRDEAQFDLWMNSLEQMLRAAPAPVLPERADA